MGLLTTLWAMARNFFVGVRVLLAELYWLAGPDAVRRFAGAKRAGVLARCREQLRISGDREIRAELERLEAEDAAAAVRFAGERALFLERLRRRTGLDREPRGSAAV